MLVSFCTACYKRLSQLEATFENNSRWIDRTPRAEWLLLNLGGQDEVDSFVRSRLPGLSARIVYGRVDTFRSWHASIAKNLAHRASRGVFLFNLDCDNFIGDEMVPALDLVDRGCRVLHVWSGIHRDGTFGRIGLTRELFVTLGGYDEQFFPMGFQDRDILLRASRMNVPVIELRSTACRAVPNTKEESVQHCGRPGMNWQDFDRLNREFSIANIRAGRLTANSDRLHLTPEIWFAHGAKYEIPIADGHPEHWHLQIGQKPPTLRYHTVT